MTRMPAVLYVILLLSFVAVSLEAADFYVDPINGPRAGNGSIDAPWRSIQAVFDAGLVESRKWAQLPYAEGAELVTKNAGAPVKAGDTIWLRSGYHGQLRIQEYYNSQNITIAAEPGHTPLLSVLQVRSGSNWTFRGLAISAEFAEVYERQTLVQLQDHNWRGPIHDIVVENCTISSVADSSKWTADDWNQNACNGFQVDGTRMTICHNNLKNVNFGISVTASHSLIQNNLVENFSGDGIRGLGDHSTFQYNTVKNCYNVNENHDDGFQSWSVGPDGVGTGEVVGIVLRGNTIINFEDPCQPHRGPLQGIGCFDGTFVDWIVENNVVVVDHWHGITLMGALRCRIVNNTVLDQNSSSPGPPWIRISAHKNGTAPEGCIVRNNLATAFSLADGVTEEFNLEIQDPAALFVDVTQFDLHLRHRRALIDTGTGEGAPKLDRDRIPRPQGGGIDVGAYEWHTQDVQPVEEDCADNPGEL